MASILSRPQCVISVIPRGMSRQQAKRSAPFIETEMLSYWWNFNHWLKFVILRKCCHFDEISIIWTTFSATSDENIIKMTTLQFQGYSGITSASWRTESPDTWLFVNQLFSGERQRKKENIEGPHCRLFEKEIRRNAKSVSVAWRHQAIPKLSRNRSNMMPALTPFWPISCPIFLRESVVMEMKKLRINTSVKRYNKSVVLLCHVRSP